MELKVVSENTVIKEVYLDDRKINIYDFGEVSRVNRTAANFKMSELNFTPKVHTDEVLYKYGINEDMYKKICKHLIENIKSILY